MMNRSRVRPLYPAPLAPPERRRLAILLPLLSRPELDEPQAAALREFAREAEEPLPLLPALYPLEPLFRHHAIRAGVAPEALFRVTGDWPPPSFRIMAEAYYERLATLSDIGAGLEERGVRSALLLKGVVLAEAYPSPALRYMCDMDMVVSPAEKLRAEEALAACGLWRIRTPVGLGWRWRPSGCLDLQIPSTGFAREVMESSIAPPHWLPGIPAGFRVPSVPHHLLILALHTAQHRGTRLWRDVCDARALLKHHPAGLMEALDVARQGARPEVLSQFLAFSEFLRRYAGEAGAPALSQPGVGSGAERREAAGLLKLYGRMACDPVPPIFMSLLRRTRRVPGRMLRPVALLKHVFRRRGGGSVSHLPQSLSEGSDPILGRVPDSGSAALYLLKARLLLGLYLGGSGQHYRRLLRADREAVQAGKPFRPPME